MKIVVTGASGMIGRALVKRLKPNNDVIEVNHDNFRYLGDFEGVNQVYHLAAVMGSKVIKTQPTKTISDNVSLMATVIDACKGTGVRVLYTSTTEIDYWQKELTDRWGYAQGKLAAESMLVNSGLDYRIARLGNVYGPGMRTDLSVMSVFNRIKAGENPLIAYSPQDTRTFLYVEDCVDALVRLMNHEDKITLNIAGHNTEIADLYAKCIEVSKHNVNLIEEPTKDVEYREVDITRAKQVLYWYPKTSLLEGLKKTWETMNGTDTR
jgi:UDP-glucuronate decarboxylase